MRISLIHGEDVLRAYERYRELVDGAKVKGFDSVSIKELQEIVGQSLFEEKTVFVLEKANKVNLKEWKWLGKNAAKYNSNLLIYWEGSAPLTVTRNLPKDAKLQKFDVPKIIFSFLESFYPGNAETILRVLNELVKSEAIELVFHLLARQMRDLYWVKVAPQTLQMPDWRVGKLKSQSGKFSDGQLKEVINGLACVDVKVKTSGVDLKTELDLLVVNYLK